MSVSARYGFQENADFALVSCDERETTSENPDGLGFQCDVNATYHFASDRAKL